jgi:hypothetical protein
MANQTEPKLKRWHIGAGLVLLFIGVGIAIGAMQRQQEVNTANIDTKVSKEVFTQAMGNISKSLDRIEKAVTKVDDKVDKKK